MTDEESNIFLVENFDQKKETRGGRYKNPRVFTEQGIAMLATILKTKNATKTSIKKAACKGENVDTEIDISIEDAFRGKEQTIGVRTVEGKLKKFKVQVPPGIQNDEKIRLVGQGRPGVAGGKNGDLFFSDYERNIDINMRKDEVGHIVANVTLRDFHDMLESHVFLEYVFDQSFLPELIEEIETTLEELR